MKLPRRNFLHLTAGAAALPALACIARAQAYPARPVRIIVGFASSGAADITARLIGHGGEIGRMNADAINCAACGLDLASPPGSRGAVL